MEKFPTPESSSAKRPEIDPERLKDIERLEEYIAKAQAEIAAEFEAKQEGVEESRRVTIAEDLHIVPPQATYLERDEAYVHKAHESMYGTTNEVEIAENQRSREGFQFELLKTAIMHKYAGNRFITVRSSNYDDIANHVDNVLVDRLTGEPLCALDEVATEKMTGNARFDKKVDTVVRSNLGLQSAETEGTSNREKEQDRFGPGARLKYGIRIREGKLECETMNNLPLFLLSIDGVHLEKGLKAFDMPGGEEVTENMYKYFLVNMNFQIEKMMLMYKDEFSELPPEMKQRILFFKGFLDDEIKKRSAKPDASRGGKPGKVSY